MTHGDESQDKSMVPAGIFIGKVTAMILALIAIAPGFGPGVVAAGAGVGLAAEAAAFVSDYNERKRKGKQSRLQRICGKLDERLRAVEVKVDDEKLDLFVEVVKKAIEDDESSKDLFYSAVLEWIVRESPNAARVRILSDGVRQLSYVELFCFLQEAHSRGPRRVLEREGIEETVWLHRLQIFGLGTTGVRMPGHTTPLGSILKKYTSLDELTPPNDIAKFPERWN